MNNAKLTETQLTWIENTFNSLTLREKIGQLVCARDHTIINSGESLSGFFQKYPVGHVFVGAEVIDDNADKASAIREKVTCLQEASPNPLLFAGDFGDCNATQIGLTQFPDIMALGATNSTELARKSGEVLADEVCSLGVNWTFSPVADLNTNPANPVTNVRAIGDEPSHAELLLEQLVEGMQSKGLAACAKHFPGDGSDSRNQHIVTSLVTLSAEEWRKKHGRVFKSLIDKGLMSIMIGHIGFPDYEPADPETGLFTPATVSKKLMTDLLRHELGFEGVIVTDALTMAGYCSWGDAESRTLATFNGGADVFLWPELETFIPLMEAALKDGRASMARLDESVKRILTMKAILNIHEPVDNPQRPAIGCNNHHNIVKELAEKSITLLRNRNNTLPLELNKGDKILLLFDPNKPAITDCQQVFGDLLKERGFSIQQMPFDNFNDIADDIEQFAAVFLLYYGKPLYCDTHVEQYASSRLWQFMSCSKIKKRVIISFGSPYYLYNVVNTDTYVNAYSGCTVSQEAAARAIFGEIPFSGTSPVRHDYIFERGDGIVTE